MSQIYIKHFNSPWTDKVPTKDGVYPALVYQNGEIREHYVWVHMDGSHHIVEILTHYRAARINLEVLHTGEVVGLGSSRIVFYPEMLIFPGFKVEYTVKPDTV